VNDREEASIFCQYVSEADIDWLFCVELNASEEFRRWISSRLFPDLGDFEHIQAWRSVSDVAGESDLLWLIETSEQGRIIALIENKIDAVAQPEQYLRYIRRGDGYVSEGLCQRFSVALLAPAKYRSSDSKAYPIQISYEALVDWFAARLDQRSRYLASIYRRAINELRTTAPADDEITQFQQRIWCLAQAEFPDLNLPDPKSVSASQYWVYMRHPGYILIYKMYKSSGTFTDCVVDLELAGRGEDAARLRQQYNADLAGTGITVWKTGKSAVFRLAVPAIAPPTFDEEKVRAALQAASRLKSWWESVSAA
jgi:hypothetical protein